jgi:hypothetical protein
MDDRAGGWGVPLFVGEFGDPPSTDQIAGYIAVLYQRLDDKLASGTQWVVTPNWSATAKDGWNTEDDSIIDDHGQLRANFHPRPFARRVAGTPTRMAVTEPPGRRALEVDWQHDPTAGATELYVAARAFFGSARVTLEATGVACTESGDLVSCSSPVAGAKHVRVTADNPSCGLTGMEALALLWLLGRRQMHTPRRPLKTGRGSDSGTRRISRN